MPDLFDITTPSNTLRLDERRQAEATYSVANLSGRLLTGRALIVPDKPEAAAWITIDGESERVFPIAGAQQYTVRLNVPKNAPPGSYTFRLDALDVSLPDETLVRGPSITFEVPQPEPEQRKFPVGILIILLLVALLIIGGIIALAGRQPEPTPTPSPSPTPTTADTPTPTATVTPTLTPTATPIGGAPGEISFMAIEAGQPAIFVMNSSGSGQQRITGLGISGNRFRRGHNAWSPSGDRIAFICNAASPFLCVLHLENGLVDQIAAFQGLTDPRISWSSDGNSIAYDCVGAGGGFSSVICVTDVRNGSTRQIDTGASRDFQPEWSPDGRRIAFASDRAESGGFRIYVADANGGNLRQLTSGGDRNISDTDPTWSPDGQQIAFVSNRLGGDRLFAIGADGSNLRPIFGTNSSAFRNPAWSPDGTMLAFQTNCDDDGMDCDIAVVQANGTGSQTLASGSGSEWGPIWRRNARIRIRPELLDRLGIQDNILVDPGLRRVPGLEFRLPTVTP